MTTEQRTSGSPTQCAYRGCKETPRMTRATATGVIAHYCQAHGQAAQILFEVKK